MSPRPRKASDEEVFAAAQRVMSRLGPTQLTLTEIASEAGLTAGALVQRFGSKRGLLLAMMERLPEWPRVFFSQLRETHPSPLAALRAYVDCFAQMGETPAALAHHLSYLQVDLTDPDFHRHVAAHARATREEFRDLLDEGVAAGELVPGVDTTALARAVEVTLSGSLMTWAFYREGSLADWMREDLEAVLGQYAALKKPRRKPSPPRPSSPRGRGGRKP